MPLLPASGVVGRYFFGPFLTIFGIGASDEAAIGSAEAPAAADLIGDPWPAVDVRTGGSFAAFVFRFRKEKSSACSPYSLESRQYNVSADSRVNCFGTTTGRISLLPGLSVVPSN